MTNNLTDTIFMTYIQNCTIKAIKNILSIDKRCTVNIGCSIGLLRFNMPYTGPICVGSF